MYVPTRFTLTLQRMRMIVDAFRETLELGLSRPWCVSSFSDLDLYRFFVDSVSAGRHGDSATPALRSNGRPSRIARTAFGDWRRRFGSQGIFLGLTIPKRDGVIVVFGFEVVARLNWKQRNRTQPFQPYIEPRGGTSADLFRAAKRAKERA
ncbi:hypothetical protein K438DRAFT_58256 [Mycena galopus ATCC 62051]|nr:hypothetical protein K438DRAFT_58256 [Mycena galopus ATCC 62051]